MPKTLDKYCPSCYRMKPISDFAKNKRQPDGLQIHCKVCHNAKSRQYRRDNPERCRLYHKNYYDSPRGKYYMLIARARRESRAVDFPLEVFCDWYGRQILNCHYCGRELAEKGKTPESLTIDRLDNNKEYTLENICLACRQCNTAKGAWFTEHQMLQIAGLYFGGNNKELAVVDVEAEFPALTYEEYMAIHSAWANSKETVENLLRRIALETCYKVRKEGWCKEEKK